GGAKPKSYTGERRTVDGSQPEDRGYPAKPYGGGVEGDGGFLSFTDVGYRHSENQNRQEDQGYQRESHKTEATDYRAEGFPGAQHQRDRHQRFIEGGDLGDFAGQLYCVQCGMVSGL